MQVARTRKLTTKAYDVLHLLGAVDEGTMPGKMQNLEGVVRTTVQPLSWQDASTGISAFDSRLIITATDEVHGEVAQLLKMLERGDAPATRPTASPAAR
jgi:hypothetical protein